MILNDKPNCQVSKILMKLRPIYVKCSETHIFEIPKFHDFNVFYKKKKMCCVSERSSIQKTYNKFKNKFAE
jgi:hypothetical protein